MAVKLLNMLAFLDPRNISSSLFDNLQHDDLLITMKEERSEKDSITSKHIPQQREGQISPLDVHGAFATLKSLSFIRWLTDYSCYSMHNLVHDWASDRLNTTNKCAMIRAVVGFLRRKQLQASDAEQKNWVATHQMAVFKIMKRMTTEDQCPELFDVISNDLPPVSQFLESLEHRKHRE